MSRKIKTIGSVSGVKQAEQENQDSNSTITSDPAEHDVAERDSGDATDPSTTGPVDGDGNNMAEQIQSNQTVASDNPTNAEVAEQKELFDGLADTTEPAGGLLGSLDDNVGGTEVTDPVDPADNLDDEINDLPNEDLDPIDEEVTLTDEEIAAAAAELEAEQTADPELDLTGNHGDEPNKPDGDALPVSKANPQADEGDQNDDEKDPVGIDGRDNFALDQSEPTAPVTKHVVGNDGQIEDVSDELLEDDDDENTLAPAHNGSGHRNTFINAKGDITVMDDETADRFYNDPKFYEYTYDGGTGKNVHVNFLRWANAKGEAVGGQVGDNYELDK